MIYAVSDIHGCYNKYQKLLKKINFGLYQEVTAGGQQFVLVHGGLDNFSSSRPLDDYEPDEILWCRPKSDTAYYPDKYVVFGHTPVQLLNMGNRNAPAKIYRSGKSIDIEGGGDVSAKRGGAQLSYAPS